MSVGFFSEASMVLPEQLLDSQYDVMAVADVSGGPSAYSSFVIIATKDNSTVEITPSALTLGFHGAGVPFTVELDAGESYQVQAIGDLSGTVINEINNNNLAVFGGARQAFVYCNLSADSHIWDQVYPSALMGQEYVLVPLMGQGVSIIKILSTSNANTIQMDGTTVVILEAGEVFEYVLNDPQVMTSSNPVQVALVNPSSSCTPSELGDPNMLIMAPTDYRTYNTTFWHDDIFDAWDESKFFVTLVSSLPNPQVSLNGEEIGTDFVSIDGTSGYYYCEKELSAGDYELLSEDGVLGYAYGLSGFDAYTYHLGFQSPISTSIDEYSELSIFVYPNPMSGEFFIQNSSNVNLTDISVFTIDGREIVKMKTVNSDQSARFNLNGFPNGMYFLRFYVNREVIYRKLIKE